MSILPLYHPTQSAEKSTFLPCEKNLHPTLPEYTGRYDVRSRVQRTSRTIEPCMPLRGAGPAYLPHKWTSTVHPEGAVYFYSQGSLRVVTDDWVYNLDVEAVISLWAKLLEDLLFKSGVQTRPGLELYLQILGEECWYYFADFDHRSIFWLNQTSTDELSLPGAISDNHLRLLMEQHFWNHVSHFPAHFGGFEPRTIDELLTVFIHGQGDQMTSRTSTFPYDRDNCERFIKLLETSRCHSTSGHVVALVARVWKVIVEHRYQTHHGEEQARLDRDSEILESEPRDGLKSSAWNAMLWFTTLGAVTSHRKRFERTMNDELVYEHDWKLFLAQTTSENQRTQINASVVTIASAVFLTTAVNSSLLLSAATILAVSSLIASLCASRHIDNLETTSAAGSQYLMWFRSKLVNFDLAGSIHAVPSALLNWSLFFFSMHIIFIIAGLPSRFPAYLVFIPLYITAFLLTFSIISRPRVFFRFKRPVNPDTTLPV